MAGIHRLFAHAQELSSGCVAIAIAGMEGALASVIGGLVSCPVIAVPASVGYGVSFEGLTALLAMLNSCASGVSAVNIDNGFGAAYQASLINHLGPRDDTALDVEGLTKVCDERLRAADAVGSGAHDAAGVACPLATGVEALCAECVA